MFCYGYQLGSINFMSFSFFLEYIRSLGSLGSQRVDKQRSTVVKNAEEKVFPKIGRWSSLVSYKMVFAQREESGENKPSSLITLMWLETLRENKGLLMLI